MAVDEEACNAVNDRDFAWEAVRRKDNGTEVVLAWARQLLSRAKSLTTRRSDKEIQSAADSPRVVVLGERKYQIRELVRGPVVGSELSLIE